MEAWKVKTIRLELAKSPGLKSINSQEGYLYEINAFERWRGGRLITGSLVELYLKKLRASGKKSGRKNLILCALRWWVRRLADSTECSDILCPEELEEITQAGEEGKNIHALQIEPTHKRRRVSLNEYSALASVCDTDVTAAGVRDRAIITLAFYQRLGRDEITSLDLVDLAIDDWGESSLVLRSIGRNDRKIILDEISLDALFNWLAIRGNQEGALFCGFYRSGRPSYRNISGGRLQIILDNRSKQAGLRHLIWGNFKHDI